MKRLLILTGILLWLMPTTASAATSSFALSPDVNLILERAQKGVDAALNPPVFEGYFFAPFEFLDWLREKDSTTATQIDTRFRIVIQRQSLATHTACFRYDQWLLEQTMDAIRYQIDIAMEEQEVFTILRLQEVYNFVGTQLEALITGGTNPELRNDAWKVPLTMEWTAPEPEQMCLFHSDYTQPGPAGYGCDAETIGLALSRMPDSPSTLLGLPAAGPAAGINDTAIMRRTLEREQNAMREAKQVADSQWRLRQGSAFVSDDVDDIVNGAEPQQPRLSPITHAEPASGCLERLPVGIILTTRQTPFTTEPDEWSLLQEFWQLWRNAAANRPAPGFVRSTEQTDILSRLQNVIDDLQWRSQSVEQAEWESSVFAVGADPGLSAEDAFADLRASVSLLVKLGNDLDGGLRGFARGFAYWLDRSCLGRPCTKRLETVLKLVFTDECFPYGNGEFTKSAVGDEQALKCLCTADPDNPQCL